MCIYIYILIITFQMNYKHKSRKLTCSLVLTTHNGFVVMAVAAPAPAAAIIFSPIVSSLAPSSTI